MNFFIAVIGALCIAALLPPHIEHLPMMAQTLIVLGTCGTLGWICAKLPE